MQERLHTNGTCCSNRALGGCILPPVGTIAVTDYAWYEKLSEQRHWDEVNFWSPSASAGIRAPEFSPFFFKLRSPHNAIAGFGYFARYTVLPEWLAWDCFGEGNGFNSLSDMQRRLAAIRAGSSRADPGTVPHIGCAVIVDAVFFSPDEWIRQPVDWPLPVQRFKRYDLGEGEGLRVWLECLDRVRGRSASYTTGDEHAREHAPVFGDPTLVRPRLGQGAFRVAVTDAYGRACAATREHSLPALDAAHIKPLAQDGPHEVRNGLLLRADLHRLFDQGYLTVNTDYIIEVSPRLRDHYENGRTYYPLHGSRISVPAGLRERPDPELLRWHNDHVFLG